EVARDLRHGLFAGVVVTDIELVDRNAALSLKLLSRRVIACVSRGDAEACLLHPVRDSLADPASTTGHNCYARHSSASSPRQAARCGGFIDAFLTNAVFVLPHMAGARKRSPALSFTKGLSRAGRTWRRPCRRRCRV